MTEIRRCDGMSGLDSITNHSISLVITDPPYSTPVVTAIGRQNFRNLADLSIQEYYFTEMRKKLELKLQENAPAVFFCNDQFYPILFSAFYPWKNSALVIWDKVAIGMGAPVRKRHELIYYVNRGFREFTPHEGHTHLPSVLTCKSPPDKVHGAQKPEDILSVFIGGFTKPGDLVVDLFGGSGSTALACQRLGRKCICFELNPDIAKDAEQRTSNLWSRLT